MNKTIEQLSIPETIEELYKNDTILGYLIDCKLDGIFPEKKRSEESDRVFGVRDLLTDHLFNHLKFSIKEKKKKLEKFRIIKGKKEDKNGGWISANISKTTRL